MISCTPSDVAYPLKLMRTPRFRRGYESPAPAVTSIRPAGVSRGDEVRAGLVELATCAV